MRPHRPSGMQRHEFWTHTLGRSEARPPPPADNALRTCPPPPRLALARGSRAVVEGRWPEGLLAAGSDTLNPLRLLPCRPLERERRSGPSGETQR